jgi:hypothetical protein
MKIRLLTIASPDSGVVFQYTLSILEAMKKIIKSSNKYEVIQIRYESFPKILDKGYIIEKRKTLIGLKIRRLIHAFTGLRIGKLAPYIEVDLIISPTIYLLPFHMGKPYIVTLHDFQQEYYPEFFTLRERLVRKIIYRTGLYANLVVCESNYVKQDVVKFLNISESRIKVLPSPPTSYLNNKEVFELLKGFDEKFFFTGEEGDFIFNVKKKGFEVCYLPEAKIIHFSGKTIKKLEQFEKVIILYHYYYGLNYFVYKNYGTLASMCVYFLILIKLFISTCYNAIRKNSNNYKIYYEQFKKIYKKNQNFLFKENCYEKCFDTV